MSTYAWRLFASSRPTADRLWPEMTGRQVGWQPIACFVYTNTTTQKPWSVLSFSVHTMTFAVCCYFTYFIHMYSRIYVMWPYPSSLEEQYYMMFYTFRRGNRLFVSLYISLANGTFVIHIQSHLYVVWSLKCVGSFHPLTFQARRRDVIYLQWRVPAA